ncbi:hypothetical protein ACLI09_17445 [Flavobacterium sp. RHBU_24]|uniref:hypothetical protein n=1 Tax=Flavobacterium sp. RHBU_24 TaxID=3391185 RepID=UPI00398527B9
MRILKKIAAALGVLFVLALIANFALTAYINKKLPTILNEQKDFPYALNYKDLDVNLWGGSFTMSEAYLAPKQSMDSATTQDGMFAHIKKVSVRGLSIWQLYKNNRIEVSRVAIEGPEVILYHTKKKYNVNEDVQKPFTQFIRTGSLEITDGSFKMLDSMHNPRLRAANIGFTLNNIKTDALIAKENIPVRYRDYAFNCDSLYYNAGVNYNITVNNLTATDTSLVAGDFKLIPKQTRKQFTAMQGKEVDQFNIQAGSIAVNAADWGFNNDTLYIHTPRVVFDKVHANIYRSKEPADDPTRKKLYSEMLRSLDVDVKVEQLLFKNTIIEYEEQLNFSKPSAKVSFSKFYATVYNVYSPVGKGKLPDTTIDVQCLFMKSAPLRVNWSFNTLDTSDAFTINGHLQNIRSEEINPVSKPLMNVTTTGSLKDIRFTFNGNRERAKGTFAIDYDDLKVELYKKKDARKKNKLLTAVGNLLVKNDSNDRLKKTDVAIDRKKDKSVFNFIWMFVQQGLKQTLLPKIAGGD